jgi:hypothetical protein
MGSSLWRFLVKKGRLLFLREIAHLIRIDAEPLRSQYIMNRKLKCYNSSPWHSLIQNTVMSIRIQLQDSQGSGCRIDAQIATLKVSHCIFQTGQGNLISFPSGELEILQTGGSRYFGVGEGFASIGDAGLSLITDRYTEVFSPDDLHTLHTTGFILMCIVCEKRLTDTLHCITVNETPVNLCCPNCAETFRRATRIVRQVYTSGTKDSDTK